MLPREGGCAPKCYTDCRDKARNEAIFDALYAEKDTLEAEFGAPLRWERLDTRQACRIALYRDGDIEAPTETLDDIRRWTIAKLLQFKKIFPARISRRRNRPMSPETGIANMTTR